MTLWPGDPRNLRDSRAWLSTPMQPPVCCVPGDTVDSCIWPSGDISCQLSTGEQVMVCSRTHEVLRMT